MLDHGLSERVLILLILSVTILGLVSRGLSAWNERMLITIGEQSRLKSPTRAWFFVGYILLLVGAGVALVPRFNNQGISPIAGLSMLTGVGIILYIIFLAPLRLFRDWIEQHCKDRLEDFCED